MWPFSRTSEDSRMVMVMHYLSEDNPWSGGVPTWSFSPRIVAMLHPSKQKPAIHVSDRATHFRACSGNTLAAAPRPRSKPNGHNQKSAVSGLQPVLSLVGMVWCPACIILWWWQRCRAATALICCNFDYSTTVAGLSSNLHGPPALLQPLEP